MQFGPKLKNHSNFRETYMQYEYQKRTDVFLLHLLKCFSRQNETQFKKVGCLLCSNASKSSQTKISIHLSKRQTCSSFPKQHSSLQNPVTQLQKTVKFKPTHSKRTGNFGHRYLGALQLLKSVTFKELHSVLPL